MPNYPNWSRFYHKSEMEEIPSTMGVIKFYWVTKASETLQYVASSENIKRRIQQMHSEGWWNKIKYAETLEITKEELGDIKKRLIDRNDPPHNK